MPISIRLEDALEIKISQTAERLNTSKAEIIRNSLEKYFSSIVTDKKMSCMKPIVNWRKTSPGADMVYFL